MTAAVPRSTSRACASPLAIVIGHRSGFALALGGIVLLALLARLAVIFSPWGELEADEAIVGLMAYNILKGEWPFFYWGQSYMGALEAYCAALAFQLLGPGTATLKLVPTFFSLGFVLLNSLVARLLFGRGPALLTALYLAVPPSMLLLWSTKPRGGYAEMLFFGQAVLLLALVVPRARHTAPWSALLGLVAGLAIWTNQLSVMYILPAAVYLFLQSRGRLLGAVVPTAVGFVAGAAPLLWANLSGGVETAAALGGSTTSLSDAPGNFFRFWRIGIPVLAGLGQPTSDPVKWLADWPQRPAGFAWLVVAANAILVIGLYRYRGAFAALWRRQDLQASGPALLLGVGAAALVILPVTRFQELMSEPRYALPLYSLVPLYAAAVWQLRARLAVFVPVAAAIAGLNLFSMATLDPTLPLPATSGDGKARDRAALIAFLQERGLDRIYADYWVGYPITFETREEIISGVLSNGFDRFAPYAHLTYVAERPAFVLVRGSAEAEVFYEKMAALGARGTVEQVSIYDVVYDVQPLQPLRP